MATLALCLLTASYSTMTHEKRYHEYVNIFYFYDKEQGQYKEYEKPSLLENVFQYACHFLRLGKCKDD